MPNLRRHTTLPITDVWADYAERYKSGKTQQQIADALGVSRQAVVNRIKWHSLPDKIKRVVSDGTLDEGHLEAVSAVVSDDGHLQPWLTTDQAQSELLAEVLGKHRGSSEGQKPTVKVVRNLLGKGDDD